jgi:hypothetical protein
LTKIFRNRITAGGRKMSQEKFTEYSNTGEDILRIIETMLVGIGKRYGIHYGVPERDVGRRFLNEIHEFESEAVQDQKARGRAAREVRENKEMPGDLYKKLVISVYQLCGWGVPVDGALEVGRAIIDNYWREKNADKSGG